MNRCDEILKTAVNLKQSLAKFIGDVNRLTDKLLELCNKPVRRRLIKPHVGASLHCSDWMEALCIPFRYVAL